MSLIQHFWSDCNLVILINFKKKKKPHQQTHLFLTCTEYQCFHFSRSRRKKNKNWSPSLSSMLMADLFLLADFPSYTLNAICVTGKSFLTLAKAAGWLLAVTCSSLYSELLRSPDTVFLTVYTLSLGKEKKTKPIYNPIFLIPETS